MNTKIKNICFLTLLYFSFLSPDVRQENKQKEYEKNIKISLLLFSFGISTLLFKNISAKHKTFFNKSFFDKTIMNNHFQNTLLFFGLASLGCGTIKSIHDYLKTKKIEEDEKYEIKKVEKKDEMQEKDK